MAPMLTAIYDFLFHFSGRLWAYLTSVSFDHFLSTLRPRILATDWWTSGPMTFWRFQEGGQIIGKLKKNLVF